MILPVECGEGLGSRTERSHYHFRISLRIWHPDTNPKWITNMLGEEPDIAWRAGDRRQTPAGTVLQGFRKQTYWTATVFAGRHPEPDLHTAIMKVVCRLERFRDFFHIIRSCGGSVGLFVGWCFEHQSGDVFSYDLLAKAADLQLDISFDFYSPTQPQNEHDAIELRFGS